MAQNFWTLGKGLRALLLLVVGAVAGLGLAPSNLPVVTLLALALGMWLFVRAPGVRAAWVMWFWIGTGYFALSLRWIIEPFLVDVARHGWMAPFALLLMAGGAAVFWAVPAWLAARYGGRGLVALTLALTLGEAARSLILTGFPWALAGHIWIDTRLAMIAAFTGPHGLSLLTFGLAACGAALAARQWRGLIGPIAVVGMWPLLALGPALAPPVDAPLVRIVHPNIPQSEKWDLQLRARNFARMLDLSRGDTRPDLIVWPESAVTELMEFADPSFQAMAETADGVPVLTGVQRRKEAQIYHNSMVVLGRGAAVQSIYDKAHLVPFGEYFPGGELAARLGFVGLASSQGGGFTAGDGPHEIAIPGVGLLRPLICYEAIFAEEVRQGGPRPDMMVLITNDAWFGRGAGPYQHLAQARLRSIELGLPMIRAANRGISAVIDAKGRIVAQLGLDRDGALEVRVPAALPPTVYARFGDAPLLILLVLSAAGVVSRIRLTKTAVVPNSGL